MSYNPFDKPIGHALAESDLQAILTRQLSEGFFLEFKRELPAQREKIARSIASFANTYGGWYLVGVEGGQHNVATAVSGFSPVRGNHDPISVITEAVKSGIDPIPVFHAQVVTLASGNLVVVVRIPGEQETPFITKDGRIYRRTHDSSAPVPKSSRYVLDELVKRGAKQRNTFTRFASEPPPHDPRWPDEDSRISIYISPVPFGVVDRSSVLTREETVSALLKRSREPIDIGDPFPIGVAGNIPLDTALVLQESIILRQVLKGNEPYEGVSIQLDDAGRCAMRIPISRIFRNADDFESVRSRLCAEAIKARIRSDLEEDGDQPLAQLRFFDIGQTWLCALNLIAFYLDWLQPPPVLAGYDIAVEANGVRRMVPFCDQDEWGEHVSKYGLPVTLLTRSRVPEFSEGPWGVYADSKLWAQVCSMVGRAFGLPSNLMVSLVQNSLLDAIERSRAPQ